MAAFLLFHLHGPMQSWGGESAVGEVRGDQSYPGKSAVLGLVAAALGMDRDDPKGHEVLHQKLGFAVRVHSPGVLLRDYHTSQVPGAKRGRVWHTRKDELAEPGLNTILSTRDYRADALFTVALWEVEPYPLAALINAFARPVYHLYLGRKACPLSLPIKPQLIEARHLAGAFCKMPMPVAVPGFSWRRGHGVYYEGEDMGFEELHRAPRRDRLVDRSKWRFTHRVEAYGRLPEEGNP